MNINGKISGNYFTKENVYTNMFDMYFKDEVTGEKIIVFNTQIRKQFKHELENRRKVYNRSKNVP